MFPNGLDDVVHVVIGANGETDGHGALARLHDLVEQRCATDGRVGGDDGLDAVAGDRLGGVDWVFNGWGAQQWASWDDDAQVAELVSDFAGAAHLPSTLVNEGGGIHVDGQGTVLLTETVQLDPGRNPGLTREDVEAELAEHSRIFTRVHRGKVKDRAVEAVISGNRPRAEMEAATTRYSFYDGRSTDLDSGTDAALMPLVSDNWTKLFTWHGVGEMPAAERERLHDYVAGAHRDGYRVRFWATNDIAGEARTNLWRELRDAGVDHINTDDLEGLQEFLAQE